MNIPKKEDAGKSKPLPPFAHGSEWLHVDVHLHTKADKEFKYTGKDPKPLNGARRIIRFGAPADRRMCQPVV